jgi:imidazolonepropionase-like amidohydrolase
MSEADIVLTNGTVIDGGRPRPEASSSIAIHKGRIKSVQGPWTEIERAGRVLDLTGLYILPGLIDAHTHLGQAFGLPALRDDGKLSASYIAGSIFRNCALALESGFTTVRDLAGLDGGIVQAIDAGVVQGPQIYPSGPALAQTGGHGSLQTRFRLTDSVFCVPGLFQRATVCDGPDAVRAACRLAFRRGATQIKVYGSGGVVSFADSPHDVHFSDNELRAAAEEAGARNTYVTSHAHNVDAIKRGLAAGIRCFEHGTYLDEETASLMAECGAQTS